MRHNFLCLTFDNSASDLSALRHLVFFFKLFKNMKNLVSEDSKDNIATMLRINA